MEVFNKTKAWKMLEWLLARVQDPILRNTMRLEFIKRARKEWGYCPVDNQVFEEEEPLEFEDWQKPVLDRINAYLEYGVDIRTNEEKNRLEAETLNNMIDFIEHGGTFWDMPEDIRSDSLKKIYDKAVDIAFAPKIFTKIA